MAAQKKRITKKEREFRAQFKKEMQEKGFIPPDKKRLNRKKFIEEASKNWAAKPDCYVWDIYIRRALSYMMAHRDSKYKISLEAVGVAKVFVIALKLKEFQDQMEKEGKNEYKLLEEYEYIKDIMDA